MQALHELLACLPMPGLQIFAIEPQGGSVSVASWNEHAGALSRFGVRALLPITQDSYVCELVGEATLVKVYIVS